MIPRLLMAAGMAARLMSNPTGAQGFSGGNPQNATQAAPNVGSNIGGVTRALLETQRDGTYTGEFIPLRGGQAALTYQRYPDSFGRLMSGLSQTTSSTKSISSSQATTTRWSFTECHCDTSRPPPSSSR